MTLDDRFDFQRFDREDPDPWLALYLDNSIPFHDEAKRALLKGNDSYSRRYLLLGLRPFIYVFFILVHLIRRIFPTWPSSSKVLHKLIYWGLKNFATPEANLLILRHFNIGTQILGFISDNVPNVDITPHPLTPKTLYELRDNTFLQHDLNIYNFVIELSQSLKEQNRDIEPPARLDFSSISDDFSGYEDFPDNKGNFIDIQTAIELYTPLYLLFLPRNDFVRAANSLQLDELIGVYVAKLLGTDYHLNFVVNGHPMVPLSTLQAGYRLMMHGLNAESLHAYLCRLKREQDTSLGQGQV